ncbi:Cell wall galactomannoprotein [Cordyceps fumosorosea ARSEF 2679]|uniref:Cell wall galactomannoprotein n=1 Tax=Cordyceps fumosorosea (strain ARSEF 2679) TaxID=1081104 RepID=A0A167QP18_CORFA|nr:Cell wall galactomannoprotein [Cordyceps fumosorosea ARSEF 2679]OAA57815.1 Cell wall galactomannoprotein [Cordyceps fumosorosea ARSEF 2679]
MRISLTLCASLAGVTLAASSSSKALVARDFDTVASVLANVTDAVNGLSTVANTGVADPATLLTASDRIVQAIQSGTARVNATGNLTFIETVHLIAPVHKLSSLSGDLTKNMVKLKGSIQKQRLCEVVRLQVGIINNATSGLIAAIDSKVPSAAQDISQALSQGITDSLTDIQKDFSDQNCVDGRNETTTSAGSPLALGPSSAFVSLCLGLVTAWIII